MMNTTYGYPDSFMRLIIALLVREDKFLPQYFDIIKPEYFDTKQLQIITSLILDYYKKYNLAPTLRALQTEVVEYHKKYKINEVILRDIDKILDYVYTCDLSDVNYVKDKILEFGRDQKLKDAVISSAKVLETGGDLESIRRMINNAIDLGGDYDLGMDFNQILMEIPEHVRQSARFDPAQIIKTGFPTLDNSLLAKGTAPGDLAVVIGPPGRGKTTFLINIMANAIINNVNSMYIPIGDMVEADIALRLSARLSGIPQEEILGNSSVYVKNMSQLLSEFKLGTSKIKAFRATSVTMGNVRSFLSRVTSVTGFKPKLLILDYIDNLLIDHRLGTYESLGSVYNELSKLAGEMEAVIWTASQPKVGDWDSKQILLSAFAESSKKAHVADLVVTLSNKPPALYIAKSRRGKDDITIPLRIDKERMIIKEDPTKATVAEVPLECIQNNDWYVK